MSTGAARYFFVPMFHLRGIRRKEASKQLSLTRIESVVVVVVVFVVLLVVIEAVIAVFV